ncbi:MAG: alpha/beta fold hydrolase [Bacteroidota bacterium]
MTDRFSPPSYRPPLPFRSGHVQTIWPTLFRQVEDVAYRRERLELADGDFLDLDWLGDERQRVAIVAHGLEGSANRSYVRGMARELHRHGWSVCAWNLRGCSGEPNRLLRAYHSGATEDLDAVVGYVLREGPRQVAVVGFSLGGNLTLKWLGEQGESLDPRITAGAGVSVPVDLAGSADAMRAWSRQIYMRYFLRKLVRKVEEKAARFDGAPDPSPAGSMTSFAQFDGHFTAPVHGFASAEDYWERSSSLPWLPHIRVPTLLLNAQDDPFLSPSCFPRQLAETLPHLHLVTPPYGGHVGFVQANGPYYSETVVADFLDAFSSVSSRSAPPSTA